MGKTDANVKLLFWLFFLFKYQNVSINNQFTTDLRLLAIRFTSGSISSLDTLYEMNY